MSLPSRLDSALALYRQNRLVEALPQFFPGFWKVKTPNVHALVGLKHHRRLGNASWHMNPHGTALSIDFLQCPLHTMVLADALNPLYGECRWRNDDSTWNHLLQAIRCRFIRWKRFGRHVGRIAKAGDSTVNRRAIMKSNEDGVF